jgi:hypothetical protein
MPFNVNGVGTSYCFARGTGGRGGDALECFVFLFMPIFPIKPFHLYHQDPGFITTYKAIPLRWSWGLVIRVYLLYWTLFPFVAGIITAIVAGGAYSSKSGESYLTYLMGGVIVTVTCSLTYLALWLTDRRNRQIRLLLGRQTIGRSDPAMWTAKRLKEFEGQERLSAQPPTRKPYLSFWREGLSMRQCWPHAWQSSWKIGTTGRPSPTACCSTGPIRARNDP